MNEIITGPVAMFVTFVIIVAMIFCIAHNQRGLLSKAALYAVSKAEEAWGSNTGRIKFAEVYSYIRKQYPLITFFFTEEQLSEIIESALSDMKEIFATKMAKDQEDVVYVKCQENIKK